MKNPLDEVLELEKEGYSQLLGDMGRGAATALGAAAIAAIPAAAQKVYGAIQKKRDFQSMMQTNPDLRELQADNPRFFNAAYSSLRRLNPTFGGDPVVAGAYMRKMMEYPDTAGLTIAQSVKAPELRRGRELGLTLGGGEPRATVKF